VPIQRNAFIMVQIVFRPFEQLPARFETEIPFVNGCIVLVGAHRVRDLMRCINFFNLPNPSSCNRPWGLLRLQEK
jgi:hypothetical protein